MDDSNVPIFAQAKLEYTKQLVDVLYMNMYDGIRSIYDDSKQLYARKATTSIIYVFRSLLEKVPKWNTEIIDSETERIMKASKCDWLDDLLTAVFISHTRILMSIGPNQNYNKINVTIPKTTTFIHKTYYFRGKKPYGKLLSHGKLVKSQKNAKTSPTKCYFG